MKLAIMQPYFLPYIGYYQLIGAVDLFIVYDNIKYVKKGWINRNRMLVNGKDALFSLPLKKDSDALDIRDRELAADFDRAKLLNQWRGAYSTAPFFKETFPLLEEIVGFQDPNLFRYLFNSLRMTCAHLGLKTTFKISSEVPIDHSLKFQDKVLALCEAEGAESISTRSAAWSSTMPRLSAPEESNSEPFGQDRFPMTVRSASCAVSVDR